jgi:protein involved in polysaccharide export with SLBB domain
MLSLAGGIVQGGNQREVAVVRGGLRAPQIARIDVKALLGGDMRQNITILPGDIIYVPRSALGKYLDVLDIILRSLAPFVQAIIITDQINPQ